MIPRIEDVEVGTRVAYEDGANPRREGRVIAILNDGREFAVEWDERFRFPLVGGNDPILGTTSDLRQHGWRQLADLPGSIFDGAEVIHTYRRIDAIRDGQLVPLADLVKDEPDFGRQAGFNCDVCLTARGAALVIPTDREGELGQDTKGRLWDVLNMARLAKPRSDSIGDEGASWTFPCIFFLAGAERREWTARAAQKTIRLRCTLGPGDHGEPVVTIGFPEED